MLRILLLITIFAAAQSSNECVQKSFGPGAIVCICNSTYCDETVEPPLQKDQFLWYVSTKDGQRMHLTVKTFTFSEENNIVGDIITVDSNRKFQDIHGFGGAMTDAAALNIRTLSNATQNVLLESYFGQTGIGYSHCRIPIAGTDFSTRPYTYDDVSGDVNLKNFSLVEEDNYKIEYLHHIKSIMPNPFSLRIFATSWSAPAWMKTSQSIQWGALKPEYYGVYANYIQKFFDEYKDRGVEIWGMTPGNEPLNGLNPSHGINAMYWSPSAEASWVVQFLEPTLSKAGYTNLVYMAMDDQRLQLPQYPDIVFQNKKANKVFSGIAHHWYADNITSPLRLTETHDKHPDKFLLLTEACTGFNAWDHPKVKLGSWDRGQQYISDIIENMRHWVTGWIDWNMALNRMGEPNWANNSVDSPIIVIPEKDEFYKQPMFYAMQHVSQFVPRNSIRIYSTNTIDQNIKSIAFLTPDRKIVVVIVNQSDIPVLITVKSQNPLGKNIKLNVSSNSFNTILYLE